MSDELQNHMNKGMYGTPQINPDERRKYLEESMSSSRLKN